MTKPKIPNVITRLSGILCDNNRQHLHYSLRTILEHFCDKKRKANLSNDIVYDSEHRLLVVVVNPSVSMKYVNAVMFGGDAVTAVDAVIRTVIPLAREHKQTFCRCQMKISMRLCAVHRGIQYSTLYNTLY